MKNLFRKVAAAWSKVPKGVKTEGSHIALTFVVTFVATASPALPSLWAGLQFGKLPDLSTLHAVVVAAAAAALKATIPVLRVALVSLVRASLTYRKTRKAAALAVAVQAYLASQSVAATATAPESETVPDAPLDPTAPRGAIS